MSHLVGVEKAVKGTSESVTAGRETEDSMGSAVVANVELAMAASSGSGSAGRERLLRGRLEA